MTTAYLIQTAASGVAILILAALAWKLGVARHHALTEDHARALLAEEFPHVSLGRIWLAADARSALARSEDQALILYTVGDGHVIRTAPWASVATAKAKAGRVLMPLKDRSAPRAVFRLGEGAVWPPVLEA